MASTAEAVIIGGGVMGCSILYNLASKGLRDALLLERDILGSGSTGRSSGAVRMHYSNEVHAQMAWKSLDIFRNFGDVVGGQCGFVQTGLHGVRRRGQPGTPFKPTWRCNSRWALTPSSSTGKRPKRSPRSFYLDDCAGIAYEPGSGHADPSGTAIAYANRARELGAREYNCKLPLWEWKFRPPGR